MKGVVTGCILFFSHTGVTGLANSPEIAAGEEPSPKSITELGTLDPHLFYFEPGVDQELVWKVISGVPETGDLDYEITDYHGDQVAAGTATTADDIRVTATVNLPRGYYQVHFPNLGVQFGLAVLPYRDPALEPDRFFSVHAELCHDDRLTYLTAADQEVRHENLFKVLHTIGIRQVRDRLVIGKFAPRPNKWDWYGTDYRYDDARVLFEQYDIDFLPNNAIAPNWMRRADDVISGSNLEENKYPSDLIAYTDAYLKITNRWQQSMKRIEIWNEPSGMTYDRLGPLIHAMAYAFQSAGQDVELVSGVFAGIKEGYAAHLRSMECWDALDMVTFHTYSSPEQMEARTALYKNTAGGEENPYLPVGISETGMKYIGGHWPTLGQEVDRAEMIVGNAVEARASGNEFFFPFKYLAARFSDGDNQTQHTLNDKYGTPFLSFASYAHSIVQLAHKEYLGDLQVDHSSLVRTRVFGDGSEAVAVLYNTGEAAIDMGVPVQAIHGMDGRELSPGAGGEVITKDRIVYVTFNQADVTGMIDSETPAMELYQRSRDSDLMPPRKVKPVVLQHFADYDHLEYTDAGYRLGTIFQGQVPLSFQATNLSQEEKTIEVELSLPPFLTTENDLVRSITIPARSTEMLGWYIQLDEEQPGFQGEVSLTATDPADTLVAPVEFEVVCPRPVHDVLNSFTSYRRIDFSDRGKWFLWGQPNSNLEMELENNTAWFSLSSTENKVGTKAFYPVSQYDFTDVKGLLVVAREDAQPGWESRYWPKISFGVDETGGAQYLGDRLPADGETHWSYVQFEKLPVNVNDDNQTLDKDQIHRFVVSTWHAVPETTVNFEVFDVYMVSDSVLVDGSDFQVTLEVVNQATGEPLEGATVVFGDSTFVTGPSGTITLEALEYGFYPRSVEANGYYPLEVSYTEVYSDTTFTWELQRDRPDITFNVLDRSSLDPVYRATVTTGEGTWPSNEQGEVILEDVAGDTLSFTITHGDYFTFTDTLVPEGDSLYTVLLTPLYADVVFEVSDGAGPVDQAEVLLGGRSGYTDTRGRITFSNQPAREMYTYDISAEGLEPRRDSFFLEVDTTLSMVLDSVTSVNGTGTGQGIRIYPNPAGDWLMVGCDFPGAMVTLFDVTGRVLFTRQLEESGGRLDMNGVPAGIYYLEIRGEGRRYCRRVIRSDEGM